MHHLLYEFYINILWALFFPVAEAKDCSSRHHKGFISNPAPQIERRHLDLISEII